MGDEHQSIEEMAAHMAGPVAAVLACVDAIQGNDFATAWALMDDELRLAGAQGWLWVNRDHPLVASEDLDVAAAALAEVPSTHRLWDMFAKIELVEFQQALAYYEPETYGAGSRPRIVDLDYEVVVFVPLERPGKAMVYDGPTLVSEALVALVHLERGSWRVARIGSDQRAVPGWPPQFPEAAGPV
jgi:hypothetical protein